MTTDSQITVTSHVGLSKVLDRQLEALATAEDRSKSSMFRILLQEAIAARKAKGK